MRNCRKSFPHDQYPHRYKGRNRDDRDHRRGGAAVAESADPGRGERPDPQLQTAQQGRRGTGIFGERRQAQGGGIRICKTQTAQEKKEKADNMRQPIPSGDISYEENNTYRYLPCQGHPDDLFAAIFSQQQGIELAQTYKSDR